jgi:MoxR-like ATPase
MPFVQQAQLARSRDRLKGKSPLLAVTLPALLAAAVPLVDSQAAADAQPANGPALTGNLERDLLQRHFGFPGAPARKPFYVPTSGWVNRDFHSSSLQAQRSERLGEMFFRSTAGGGSRYFPAGTDWDDFAKRVMNQPKPVLSKGELFPLFDLACWLYLRADVESPEALLASARYNLKVPDELIGTIYSGVIPDDANMVALGAYPLEPEALAEVLETRPPPPDAPESLASITDKIVAALRAEGLEVDTGVVDAIVGAWITRDMVVLVGAPGTGKSTLAGAVARALADVVPEERFVHIPVGEDWTSGEVIGYENLAGRFVPKPLARILQSTTPAYPHVVILEEFNLSKVEHYMPTVLHAIESDDPQIPLPGAPDGWLPIDTLIIATCNSPRDEPTTRIPVSGPTVQRMSVVEMPNLLHQRWQSDGEAGIVTVITNVLKVERAKLRARERNAASTWLDPVRAQQLGDHPKAEDLDAEALAKLVQLVATVLNTKDGQRWMTLRMLSDLAVRTLMRPNGVQLRELVAVIQQKLVHQVREAETFDAIKAVCDGLPGSGSLNVAISRMQNQYGDITPLI